MNYIYFNKTSFVYLICICFLVGCKTVSTTDYEVYNGLPCSFFGVTVGDRNDNAQIGDKTSSCNTNRPYKGKRGQTFLVKRGTPIVAPADLKLRMIVNYSALENCVGQDSSATKHIRKYGCMRPYDALKLELEDFSGNIFLFYHLMDKSPFVPGFGKGRCTPTKTYRAGSVMGYPSSCGGLEMEYVSKGDVIGYSGTTSKTEHFSLAVRVKNHPDFPGEQGWIVPTNELRWENLPSYNPNLFLSPVQPKNAQ